MGSGSSKSPRRDDGGQLYVSVKMESSKTSGDLVPHVYGSLPITGSWDASKALSMQRESASMWELSFIIPPNHETLDFKFLLKPNYGSGPCVVEEGPDRLLTGGTLEGDVAAAVFRLPGEEVVLEFRVLVKADILSPFDLAASWRTYQENLQPSRVRGIPDVSINAKYDGVLEKTMPAAAGAVAAAAVADRMHGPKEDRKLAIVLVGLPARGKTFTAAKLTRYLRWLGHETKHFNVGKYRRLKHGANQSADFFRGDNPEGMDARNEVAVLAMDDMLSWMQEGGQVGIFDATNSTRERRNMLMKMAEGKCKLIFLETLCNDQGIIERNIRMKIQQSPDYADISDFEAGLQDFKTRLANYEKIYEPVEEGSYIKMIDMVSGHGGQLQVNNISGYLPGRIVFFLVNTHLTPRPILLTRHGESQYNVRGRIGGDAALSETGELYVKKLTNFVEQRLKFEKIASISTERQADISISSWRIIP